MFDILENTFKIQSLILRQFIVYGFVALIPTVVDFGLVYVLTEYFYIYYIYSVIVGFLVALGVSYFVQKNITFKNQSRVYIPQFSIFATVSLGALFLNIIFVSILVEYFGFWYMFAKTIAQTIIYLWSFGANRFVTFEKFQ